MLVLFNAGDHVPIIPFVEVVESGAKTSPLQIGATDAKVGVTFWLTVIVNEVVVAHWPVFGVKVYKVVLVLFNAGDQVPVIPFVVVVGNGLNVWPEQIGLTALNVGVTFGVTLTVNVVEFAHWLFIGVKV